MKKTLIKLAVFLSVFVITLVVAGKIMNKDHNNMTMEMAEPTLPVVVLERDGIRYNEMHGYTMLMDIASMRGNIAVLEENRGLSLYADLYGNNVSGLSMEVRSIDGSRLIEQTPLRDYTITDGILTAKPILKDLIEKDTEYALMLTLTLDEGKEVYYYTRVIWSDQLYVNEKLRFCKEFHDKLYDKEAARGLTKYLETNSALEDNSSFHKVNIHSSFKQITWGNLQVKETVAPTISLVDIAEQTASVLLDYYVATGSEEKAITYRVKEHFRIRYTAERVYLLDYERTMTQLADPQNMYANDKILLGITGTDIPLHESEDGSNVVFEVNKQLFSYNEAANKLAVIFSFSDKLCDDARTRYDGHDIKVLDVTEGGDVSFAVYGYMNRGRHEGEVGIQIYTYSSTFNTIDENVYIPYNKSAAVLKAQMEKLLYMNREQKLYLVLEDVVYGVDLSAKTYYPLVKNATAESLQVSDNNRLIVWQNSEDTYGTKQLNIRNLNTEKESMISSKAGESIRPLGFMGEDIIYGLARNDDILRESSGRIFFPMYKIVICNSDGEILKEYGQENYYVTECVVDSNQITIKRVKRDDKGRILEATDDHIMNSVEEQEHKYKIVAPQIETYGRYVQIQARGTIDTKTIQILTPKEVVFEGGRTLALEHQSDALRYYVYGAYGVEGTFSSPAKAVEKASECSGVVVNQNGIQVWRKGNRSLRNQIMAITKQTVTEQKGSLAVCLDTILAYEGIIRNSEYLLSEGQSVMEILQNNLETVQILDLAGCELNDVLYYVDHDIPVLALLNDGEAVVITGYNELNVVVMNPADGTLAKKGMKDAEDWLRKNGNNFVTYTRKGP